MTWRATSARPWPAEEQQRKIEAGTALQGTKDFDNEAWDGSAALEALRKKFPPMTAEEKSGGPPCAVEANTGLASCLDKLARLEKKVIPTDHFKVKAYVAAAAGHHLSIISSQALYAVCP